MCHVQAPVQTGNQSIPPECEPARICSLSLEQPLSGALAVWALFAWYNPTGPAQRDDSLEGQSAKRRVRSALNVSPRIRLNPESSSPLPRIAPTLQHGQRQNVPVPPKQTAHSAARSPRQQSGRPSQPAPPARAPPASSVRPSVNSPTLRSALRAASDGPGPAPSTRADIPPDTRRSNRNVTMQSMPWLAPTMWSMPLLSQRLPGAPGAPSRAGRPSS